MLNLKLNTQLLQIREYNYQEFENFILSELEEISDFELVILKGHIITEFTLNCYLEILSNNSDADFFKENFSFDSKIKILSHFGDVNEEDEPLLKALKLLNKVRNGIAHTLDINIQLVKEFLAFIEMHSADEKLFERGDQFIKHNFLAAIGYLSGYLFLRFIDLREFETRHNNAH